MHEVEAAVDEVAERDSVLALLEDEHAVARAAVTAVLHGGPQPAECRARVRRRVAVRERLHVGWNVEHAPKEHEASVERRDLRGAERVGRRQTGHALGSGDPAGRRHVARRAPGDAALADAQYAAAEQRVEERAVRPLERDAPERVRNGKLVRENVSAGMPARSFMRSASSLTD
jgi:hypothetical protein